MQRNILHQQIFLHRQIMCDVWKPRLFVDCLVVVVCRPGLPVPNVSILNISKWLWVMKQVYVCWNKEQPTYWSWHNCFVSVDAQEQRWGQECAWSCCYVVWISKMNSYQINRNRNHFPRLEQRTWAQRCSGAMGMWRQEMRPSPAVRTVSGLEAGGKVRSPHWPLPLDWGGAAAPEWCQLIHFNTRTQLTLAVNLGVGVVFCNFLLTTINYKVAIR